MAIHDNILSILGKHDCQYESIPGHIGCHSEGGSGANLGLIGRPMDFLNDVSSSCTTGDSRCIEIGKRACCATPNCWGFGIHSSWGVQIYDKRASNQSVCSGTNGLGQNKDWNTYKKLNFGMTLTNYVFKSCNM